MALFSLHHSTVGRTTHKAGTAGAHIRYIFRSGAHADPVVNRMPDDPVKARKWIDRREPAQRKNARVIDKIMAALPCELHPLQRRKLVRDFCERVTKNRAPYCAAIHQVSGNDRNNPHVHIVIHDRDLVTGKTVAQLSNKHSTEYLRRLWEQMSNAALERAGQPMRIDRRSYQAQDIEKQPTQHRGPGQKAIRTATGAEKKQRVPESQRAHLGLLHSPCG
jgi:hypothetical protein